MAQETVKFCPHPLGLNLLEWAERNELVRLMVRHEGNISAVAEEIPVSRGAVYHRLKALKVGPDDWKAASTAPRLVPADFGAVTSYLERRVCSRAASAK